MHHVKDFFNHTNQLTFLCRQVKKTFIFLPNTRSLNCAIILLCEPTNIWQLWSYIIYTGNSGDINMINISILLFQFSLV